MTIETTKQACSDEPISIDWGDVYVRAGVDPALHPITSSAWVGTNITAKAPQGVVGSEAVTQMSDGTVGTLATLHNTIAIPSLGIAALCETIELTITE